VGRICLSLLLAVLLILPVPSLTRAQTAPQPAAPPFAAIPEDGQWTIPQKNYANTRYSDLSEISTENVKNLQVAFTFSTGVNRGQESAPLVVGGTMYVLSPYPNILYALDLTKEGAPMKWQYNPKPAAAAQGVACCDVVNRGPTYSNGRIFFTTLDAHVVAVNADTGEEVWKTKLGDINRGETMTMAPLVAKGKVFVGISGGEYGVRGWIHALNEADGTSAWKAYNTGPDQDVKIGPNFKPFYDSDKGMDLGVTTWPADAWRTGGGSVWGWLSEPAPRRQQMDRRDLRPRSRHRRRPLVLPDRAARYP
jgi:PQQ-dependent dehydrogenase (methanol/ethanol family)